MLAGKPSDRENHRRRLDEVRAVYARYGQPEALQLLRTTAGWPGNGLPPEAACWLCRVFGWPEPAGAKTEASGQMAE